MKTSVVIPCYNEAIFLPRLLESIKSQTIKPDEVIVVDNNSIDSTAEIARKYGAMVVSESVQGIIPARNKGYDSTSGDIIIRTDADTIVPDNWIENIINHFLNPNIVGVGGPVLYHEMKIPISVMSRMFNTYYSVTNVVYGRPILYGPNTALRRDVWNSMRHRLEINDRKVHEDMEFSYKLSEYGDVVFDYNIVVGSSHRRVVRKPLSMFVEYPYRGIKTWLRVKNLLK